MSATPQAVSDTAPNIASTTSDSSKTPEKTLAEQQAASVAPTSPKAPDIDPDPQNATVTNIEKLVTVKEHPGNKPAFRFQGLCTKCGWQSFMNTAEAAFGNVAAHAQRHLLGL